MTNITRRKDQGLGATARGGSSGSFASHERASAAPPPPHVDPNAEVTAEQVRSPEFTRQVMVSHWPGAEWISSSVHPADESLTEHRLRPGFAHAQEISVTVNSSGDIANVATFFPIAGGGEGAWLENRDDRDRLQAKVRTQRLAAIGVNARGVADDDDSIYHRFTGTKAHENSGLADAAQVSKQVRQDVKRAVEFGALPSDVHVRVRTHKYNGGQAVYIDATMPVGTRHVMPPSGLSEADADIWQYHFGGRPSIERKNIRESLEAIGNQWNDIERDATRGYHSSSYHLLVQVREGEHEREAPTGLR